MNKERLIRNLEAELQKIERQDRVYGVGETRYDLMIKDVLNYIENSIPKSILRHKIQELEYDQLKNTGYIVEDRIKINFIKELLEGK